jgi:peptide/nickel transport system substrate-binding protein
MKKLLLILVTAIFIISMLAGCSTSTSTTTPPATSTPPTSSAPPTTTPPAGPKYGGTLKEISLAVPALVGWPPDLVGASSETPQVVFDPFLRGDVNGNYQPWLAESYKLADDHMSITFKLREDVNFHDGSHLNAEIAKWNLDNLIAANMQPYWDSVEALDEYTVRVNFKEWRNTMFAAFSDGSATWMVSKAAYDLHGEDWMRENPVGTGPFKFISFSRDQSFVVEKNPDWWQPDLPYLDRYEILYVADPTTQLAMMQTGEADVIGMEPGKMAADLAKIGLTVDTGIVSMFGLVPDTANPSSIWANEKFREAVEYAIDREAIAKDLGYGYLNAPYQLPTPGNPSNDPNFVGRRYDPEKAKELLTEAGYPNGAKAKIIVSSLAPSKDAVLAVQAYLAAVGIDVELDFPQWSKYVTYLRGTWEDAALFQVFPVLGPNYNATLGFYFDPNGTMLQSWQRTDEFTEMFNASARSPEPDQALIKKVLDYIYDNALIIPVHEAGRSYAYQPYVMNGNWLQRSMSAWKYVEQIWLDK